MQPTKKITHAQVLRGYFFVSLMFCLRYPRDWAAHVGVDISPAIGKLQKALGRMAQRAAQ